MGIQITQDFSSQINNINNAVPSAMSRTFYVDAVSGNDANDGSENAPFKTLNKVASISPKSSVINIYLKSDYTIDSATRVEFNFFKKIIFNSYTGSEKIVAINDQPRAPFLFSSCGDVRFNCEFQGINSYDPTVNRRPIVEAEGITAVRFKNLTVADAITLVTQVNEGGMVSLYVLTSNITTQEANGHVPFYFYNILNGSINGVFVERASTTIDGVQVDDSIVSSRIGGIVFDANGVPRNVVSNIIITL